MKKVAPKILRKVPWQSYILCWGHWWCGLSPREAFSMVNGVIQLKLRVPTSRPPTSWGKPSCWNYHRLECKKKRKKSCVATCHFFQVTVGSNPTLVEFKGRSDMMIKVPLTGGPIFTCVGKIDRNWDWDELGVNPASELFPCLFSPSGITQRCYAGGCTVHRPVRDRKTFGASTGGDDTWLLRWMAEIDIWIYGKAEECCKALPFSNRKSLY